MVRASEAVSAAPGAAGGVTPACGAPVTGTARWVALRGVGCRRPDPRHPAGRRGHDALLGLLRRPARHQPPARARGPVGVRAVAEAADDVHGRAARRRAAPGARWPRAGDPRRPLVWCDHGARVRRASPRAGERGGPAQPAALWRRGARARVLPGSPHGGPVGDDQRRARIGHLRGDAPAHAPRAAPPRPAHAREVLEDYVLHTWRAATSTMWQGGYRYDLARDAAASPDTLPVLLPHGSTTRQRRWMAPGACATRTWGGACTCCRAATTTRCSAIRHGR